jgi:hypothetical protein
VAPDDARQALARRLRTLRERHWQGRTITQHQLAAAFGGHKPLSVSLISSWENPNTDKSVIPPERRIQAYATFFATPRSVETVPYRVLMLSQLDENEQAAREKLWQELKDLWDRAVPGPIPQIMPQRQPGGFWHFGDENIVTIVCAQLPQVLRTRFGDYSDPKSPDYVALYTYADPDALIELHGQIRAVNPNSPVYFKTTQELVPDDYTSHLVLLGGVDWNSVTSELLRRIELPVSQVARHQESDIGGFEVHPDDARAELFAPRLDADGHLIEDIGHFYRGPNPFNARRTVTICNGMYGRGTLGVVRALTDPRFRTPNHQFLTNNFAESQAFSIIIRILVVQGKVLTPDWNLPTTRLHEWRQEAPE